MAAFSIPRIIIAGTGSGVGKTTVTVGLIQALKNRGLKVSAFKCGPDYLDPTYHARVLGQTCHNLDGWMMGRDAVLSTFIEASQDSDIAIIEGVMGLFDGLSPTSLTGSTAEIAKWLEAPVIAVLDASGMAATLAPIVRGLAEFDPDVRVGGVIANFAGSDGHLSILRTATTQHTRATWLGGFIKNQAQTFPERHLGLYGAENVSESSLKFWGDECAARIDLDQLLEIAATNIGTAPTVDVANTIAAPPKVNKSQPTCRIGVALDGAFHFYYADNLRRLRDEGAELCFFSPIKDQEFPAVDALYFGGGYPELYAKTLSENRTLIEQIRQHAFANKPIYAECGGLMYLTESLTTAQGESFDMANLIPGRVVMGDKLKSLGYVEVATEQDSILGEAGVRFRGHQFRYSELILNDGAEIQYTYRIRKRRGGDTTSEGYAFKNVLASYVHAHWASNPSIASHFVNAARSCS